MASALCGEFKFSGENNYKNFLAATGAPAPMIEHVMSGLQNVSKAPFI